MQRNDVGKWGVNYRCRMDMLHKEMAEKLGVSASYLSGIEHGRKQVPEDWWERVAATFKLSLPEATELRIAAMRSRREVTVTVETDLDARIMVAFEENRAELDMGKAKKIEAILLEGTGQEDELTEEKAAHT
ncbi:MAG: helix-turn-helix transcriptional regulator [Pseudomonadota bacterium]